MKTGMITSALATIVIGTGLMIAAQDNVQAQSSQDCKQYAKSASRGPLGGAMRGAVRGRVVGRVLGGNRKKARRAGRFGAVVGMARASSRRNRAYDDCMRGY
jgi:hypothetical protein